MNILMISSYLPYPLLSGGQVRLYNLIKEFSQRHEITLICEKRQNQSVEDVKEVEKICKKVITVERRKQWSVENILKSGFSSHSFLVTGHTHKGLREEIAAELATNSFDLIHVETFYVMQNVLSVIARRNDEGKSDFPKAIPSCVVKEQGIAMLPSVARNDKIPIVLVEHNIEYHVYQRFVDRVLLPLWPLFSLDIAKIKREEEAAWRRAAALVTVSEDDKKVIEETGLSPTIVANGVNIDHFRMKNIKNALEAKEKRILFIGDFKWIQNRDSAAWIIQEIWQKIKNVILERTRSAGEAIESPAGDPISRLRSFQDDKLKLWIVGRKIPESIKQLTQDPDVVFDEESSARPTPEIFQKADVLLAPIRIGGGTSYKILESMASGTPVVTMPLSAESLGAKDNYDLMVGQNTEELAQKTVLLLQDRAVYERISRNARALIEEKYSWKEIARTLETVYANVIAND